MAMQIVTGHVPGTANVTAQMAGLLNAGIAGTGSYVLPVLDRLSCTVETANRVTVGTGALLLEGREGVNLAPEALVVESGTQAMRRHDLVCATYRMAEDGTESMSLSVVRGEPHATDPADPALPSGSVLGGAREAWAALWRLPLDGVSLGTPVRLLPQLPTLADLMRPTVTTPANGCTAMRAGGVVTVQVLNMTCSTGYRTVATLPAGMRPDRDWYGTVVSNQDVGFLTVSPAGLVRLYSDGVAGDYTGQLTYPVVG